MIKQYRKKPLIVSAILWNGFNFDDFLEFTGLSVDDFNNAILKIKTPEGVMLVDVGDYIIKGVNGEFYPCKPDVFIKTYEEAE